MRHGAADRAYPRVCVGLSCAEACVPILVVARPVPAPVRSDGMHFSPARVIGNRRR